MHHLFFEAVHYEKYGQISTKAGSGGGKVIRPDKTKQSTSAIAASDIHEIAKVVNLVQFLALVKSIEEFWFESVWLLANEQ